MHALRFDPGSEATAIAADVMAARYARRERFISLAVRLGGYRGPDYHAAREKLAEMRVSRARNRRAKDRAREIGLSYWPALIADGYQPRVDPRAYVAAERVLNRRHGEWCPEDGCHGGWDSKGHHGVDRVEVARYWYAAGCRDSRKFRAQVVLRAEAKKGDSLPFLLNLVRGARWASAWGVDWRQLSRKAQAALGRLSPELRHAAVRGLPEGACNIRVRDLNWAEVRRIQALRADPTPRALALRALVLPARPAAVVLGRAGKRGMAHPITNADVVDLCPSYPTVALAIARRITAGESPASISGGLLTRKEAHAWLRDGGPVGERDIPASICCFLVRDLPLSGFTPRDPLVARWLAHVHQRGAWSALTRVERHPDGRAMCRMDVIDEITPADLDRGISTGVERAFERAGERLAKIDEGDNTIICRNPFGRLPRAMAALTTPAALAAEGRALGHCVGGYAQQVRAGQCLIISIASRHGRSTVELRRGHEWTASQHRGRNNGEPPRRHQQLLRAFLARANNRAYRRAA